MWESPLTVISRRRNLDNFAAPLRFGATPQPPNQPGRPLNRHSRKPVFMDSLCKSCGDMAKRASPHCAVPEFLSVIPYKLLCYSHYYISRRHWFVYHTRRVSGESPCSPDTSMLVKSGQQYYSVPPAHS